MKEDKKIIEIKDVYKLKKGYLYTKPSNCWNFEKDYLINGLSPITTFKKDFYYSETEIKKIEEKKIIKVNECWQLKNKDLYNEKIPMLIDNSTKEIFNSLIEDNLYDYTFEEKNIKENIEFKILNITDINIDNKFNEYEIKKEYNSWCGWQEVKKYIINDLIYNLEDNCLTPSPIKELTRPCLLSGGKLYEIIRDYIKRNIDANISKVSSDYDFTFAVKDIRTGGTIFKANNGRFTGSRDYLGNNFEDIIAINFNEMLDKIDIIKEKIIEHINYQEKTEVKGFVFIKEILTPEKVSDYR